MEVAYESMEVAEAMARRGLEASVSDAGVAAVCARSAVMGAFLNVRINTAELQDQAVKDDFLKRGAQLQQKAMDKETEILRIVDEKL
jgi:glutamate formiminotransferase/formiminotetrahydrofolate cyclodeaminase